MRIATPGYSCWAQLPRCPRRCLSSDTSRRSDTPGGGGARDNEPEPAGSSNRHTQLGALLTLRLDTTELVGVGWADAWRVWRVWSRMVQAWLAQGGAAGVAPQFVWKDGAVHCPRLCCNPCLTPTTRNSCHPTQPAKTQSSYGY